MDGRTCEPVIEYDSLPAGSVPPKEEIRPFTREFVVELLTRASTKIDDPQDFHVRIYEGYSNDLAEVELGDGRLLMVKRGRHEWRALRFRSSRMASRLLRERTEVVAPMHLEEPRRVGGKPVLAYWRIGLPTLEQLWPEIPRSDRGNVVRSLGRLLREIHEVTVGGFGPLAEAGRRPTLDRFLTEDLEQRLLPAVKHQWPSGRRLVEQLSDAISRVAENDGEVARLAHNDLHLDNILCEVGKGGTVRCAGVLDLEAAVGGPAEADLASADVLHQPLFAQEEQAEGFQDHVRAGYDQELDETTVSFFRAYHLLNMGYYAAVVGQREHAGHVARAAEHEISALPIAG